MDENIKDELLDEEIVALLNALRSTNPVKEKEDYETLMKAIQKLMTSKKESDLAKAEIEFKRLHEENQKNIAKTDKLTNYLKVGVEVAGIVLPLVFYASWMKKGFKFEETGSFTSTTFKGLFQKFKTTK